MKKTAVLLLYFLLIHLEASFAQKQADWWFFGFNTGLDFTTGSPVPVTASAINTSGGCSSISDTAGHLLFYTDGITVYTNENTAMPNSGDLMGDQSSTQSAQIVPDPAHENLYYIFTVPANGGTNGFRYSIVDLTLNGGFGDVSTKNIFLKSYVTEKLSAVSNRDGSGYWVMIHEWASDAFDAYQITSSGLDTNAVVSHVGTVHSDSIIQNTIGQMKFSPNGKKIADAIGYQGLFELFDFDDQTGVVSNPISIPTGDRCYGVEFSADNSKLYVTHYDPFFDVYYLDQYDISSNDEATIIASKLNIFNAQYSTQLRALQLGPDRKIYLARAFTSTLGVINQPDSAGTACGYNDNGVDLNFQTCGLGLPGFVQSFFRVQTPPVANFVFDHDTICKGTCLDFTDSSENAVTYSWIFEGAVPDTSTAMNPAHICYNEPGSFLVTLIVSNSIGRDSIQKTLYVDACDGVKDISKNVSVLISPNIVSDKILLTIKNMNDAEEIKIVDALGQIVFTEKITIAGNEIQKEIDAGSFAKGIYLLRLEGHDGSYTARFLKQ